MNLRELLEKEKLNQIEQKRKQENKYKLLDFTEKLQGQLTEFLLETFTGLCDSDINRATQLLQASTMSEAALYFDLSNLRYEILKNLELESKDLKASVDDRYGTDLEAEFKKAETFLLENKELHKKLSDKIYNFESFATVRTNNVHFKLVRLCGRIVFDPELLDSRVDGSKEFLELLEQLFFAVGFRPKI